MTRLKNIIKERWPILFLLAVSAAVVFYRYLAIPKNTTFDEVEFGKLALLLGKQPYVPYSAYATGHATLYFYIILLSFRIFGVSLLALRLPAAVFGFLNPVLFYLVLQKVFKKSRFLPFITTLIFATMRWYFNFTRFGFEVTFLLFLELLSILFALMYCDKNKNKFLVLSGVFAGLAYNSYQPGRIFAVIPLFIIFSRLVKAHQIPPKIGRQLGRLQQLRTQLEIIVRPILYFIVPFIILILPLTLYLQTHKDTRFYQQFYPDNHEMTLKEKEEFFVRNLASTAGIFNVKGDINGRHNYPGKPALNPILGVLFLAGLLVALFRLGDRNNALFLGWFLLSLLPTLVTYPWENPNMLRTFTAIPTVAYFAGLSIRTVLNLAKKPFIRKAAMAVILTAVMFSVYYELKTYFVYQAQVFNEAFETTRDIRVYLTP